jgi:hypothetical protein
MAVSLAPGEYTAVSKSFHANFTISEGTSTLKMRIYITVEPSAPSAPPSTPSSSATNVHPDALGIRHLMPDPHIPCVCPICLDELDEDALYEAGALSSSP